MDTKKILIVGGTWDERKIDDEASNNRKSGLITKLSNAISNHTDYSVQTYNGGNYETLQEIIESTPDFNYVFWFANIKDNTLAKIRNVKDYAPRCMLITSKRNDNGKYDLEELLQRALAIKANLCFEFSKIEDRLFNIRIFDPLGCVWYNGTSIENAVTACMNRLGYLSSVTRKPSINTPEVLPEIEFSDTDNRFLEFVKKSAETFHRLMCLPPDVKRFVGNASLRFKKPTRCMSGFPAIKKSEDVILISRRNVNKTGITKNDFVPCTLNEDGTTLFYGEYKPSVDTPVQIRLFKLLPNIKYILHGHCYIKDIPMTKVAVPCGAIEEVDEILDFIDTNIKTRDADYYAINLKGHGCLILASENTLDKMEKTEFTVRPLPEIM